MCSPHTSPSGVCTPASVARRSAVAALASPGPMRVAPAELASTARALAGGTRAPSRATPASARRRTSALPASGVASVARRATAKGAATAPRRPAATRGSAASPAGATSTSRRTRLGMARGARIAIAPPIEWPTRS